MSINRRRFIAHVGCTAGAIGLCGCVQTNVATGRSSYTGGATPQDDIAIGREQHPQILEEFGGEYEDPRLTRYVTELGNKLASFTEYQYPYRFTVLNSPIVNAFALPGGYVYISRGLLAIASNEAELAGVLAHELGHVVARHSAERQGAAQIANIGVLIGAIGAQALGLPGGDVAQLGQTVAGFAISSYSRDQESEADLLGVRYMSRAGYDPDAMVTFLATLREQSQLEAEMAGKSPDSVDARNMSATHPRTIDRVRAAQTAAAEGRPANAVIAREPYLAAIDGMLFGDDPRQGIVRDTLFVHPVLRFEFRAPAGFRLQNSPNRLTASHPQGAVVLFDLGPMQRPNRVVDYVQREWAAKTRLRELQPLSVNDIEAATGWTTVNTRNGPADVRLVAFRRDQSSVYRMTFITPSRQTKAFAEEIRRMTWSFRYLSPDEAAAVQPMRLLVVEAQPNDSVATLSGTLPFGRFNEAFFRMLNDLGPGGQVQATQRIKVIAP